MSMPKIYADFHNLDDSNRVRMTCAGTLADLSRQGIELHEGLQLTLYMDDADDERQPDELLADGVVHYCTQEHCWVARVDWDTVRHASEEKVQSVTGSNSINRAKPQDARETQAPNSSNKSRMR